MPMCRGVRRSTASVRSGSFAFTLVQTGRNYSEIRATFGPERDIEREWNDLGDCDR